MLNISVGQAQTQTSMTNTNNPLLCDPVEGACGLPASTSRNKVDVHPDDQPVKVIYFTDPICSSCWGIEPQLRKLKLEYGHILDIAYHMGGLLPDWSYNSGGISKPSDVAHHWDEVSVHYDMPIDGDVWLEDPLHSSYPPSIAFKAAQMQDEQKAIVLLRELREMVFLQKTNITRWEHIAIAAEAAGLDVLQLKTDYEGEAKANFESDLQLAKSMGVRGFPSVFFVDKTGNSEFVYGTKAYPYYEMAILKLYPDATKKEYTKDWESLFQKYPTLTAKEYTELSGTPRADSEKLLRSLSDKGVLKVVNTKNGSMWKKGF